MQRSRKVMLSLAVMDRAARFVFVFALGFGWGAWYGESYPGSYVYLVVGLVMAICVTAGLITTIFLKKYAEGSERIGEQADDS